MGETASDARPGAFASLRHRDFAWFFAAAVVSNSGSWMQTLSVPFVVYEITGSKTWLGLAAVLSFLPGVVANALAGAVVDRYDRRRVIMTTQIVQMLSSFTLWALWVGGVHSLGAILAPVMVGGAMGGLQTPVWQSFVPLLVPREHLTGAVRLNGLQYAAARALGPFAAGMVLRSGGPGTAFFVNAVTFLLVIGVLVVVKPRRVEPQRHASAMEQLREGWRYVLSQRRFVVPPLTMLFMGLCGSAVVQLAAALARDQYRGGDGGIGVLVSAFGAGSIIGSLVVAFVGDRVARSSMTLVGLGCWITGLSWASTAHHLGTGMVGLFVMGIAHVTTSSTLNTALQLAVDEAHRGRAIAVYLQGFMIGSPLGALVLGRIADATSLTVALRVAAGTLVAFVVVASIAFDRFRLIDATTSVADGSLDDPPSLDGAGTAVVDAARPGSPLARPAT